MRNWTQNPIFKKNGNAWEDIGADCKGWEILTVSIFYWNKLNKNFLKQKPIKNCVSIIQFHSAKCQAT